MLRFLTSGESHGEMLIAILEGMPAGLTISSNFINNELKRRQLGFGRSERMQIETDEAEIVSGLYNNKTIGSPICLIIKNKGLSQWTKITSPRPGHADLAGITKYGFNDIRGVLERASARETVTRVAIGAIIKQLLKEFNITIFSLVIEIGGVKLNYKGSYDENLKVKVEKSYLSCPDEITEEKMKTKINKAKKMGDSLGGIFEVVGLNIPVGLGSYVHFDRRLDACLAYALMSIPAIKGVEIGAGFCLASKYGSEVHDEIFYDKHGFYRKTNNAGGIEGGMSNGEPIILRAVMKPIPTLEKPLKSVDILTKEQTKACKQRSDICAVPSAAVVGEAMVSYEIANSFLEKFGGDSLTEIKKNYKNYIKKC